MKSFTGLPIREMRGEEKSGCAYKLKGAEGSCVFLYEKTSDTSCLLLTYI